MIDAPDTAGPGRGKGPSGRLSRLSPAVVIGIVSLALSGAVMAGWLLQNEWLLRLLTVPPMVFSTALCFALAGLALACDTAGTGRKWLRLVPGAIILTLGAGALGDHVLATHSGIDLEELHQWFPDSRPNPGRMSLAASIGFMLIGLNFLTAAFYRAQAAAYWQNAVCATIVAIGLFNLAGNAFGLEALFANRFFQLVSLSTAVGFVAIGGAQWLAWRRRTTTRLADDDRIVLTGAALILLVGAAVALAAVFTLGRSTEDALGSELRLTVVNRTSQLTARLEEGIARAESVAQRSDVVWLYDALRGAAPDSNYVADLRQIANAAVGRGFSLVEFRDTRDAVLAAAVSVPADAILLFVPEHRRYPVRLLWRDGPILHVEIPILSGQRKRGRLYAQLPMPDLKNLLELEGTPWEGAQLVCAGTRSILPCSPDRRRAVAFGTTPEGQHPAKRAQSGETGLAEGFDYRGRRTISAFAPVKGFGLGMALTVETKELFRPLGRKLAFLLPLMLAMLAGGALLLRAAVKPLAERLHDSEQRLKLALEGSRFALWDWNIDSGVVFLSEQWQEMLGGPSTTTLTTVAALQAIVHPDDVPALEPHLEAVLKGDLAHYDIEYRVRNHQGDWIWIHSRGQVVERGRNGRALRLTGTHVNITARKRAELALEHEASHDPLTGLPNRSLFYDRLEQALKRSARDRTLLAVFYLDIDKFKQFNDNFGHAVGDAVLREFARRLTGAVRSVDTVARLAGDEFAVIVQDLAQRDDAKRIADKVLEAMRAPFGVEDLALDVGTSIGIAVNDKPADADRLVAIADQALYAAKSAGRGAYRIAD